jgi:hypothetical protein
MKTCMVRVHKKYIITDLLNIKVKIKQSLMKMQVTILAQFILRAKEQSKQLIK